MEDKANSTKQLQLQLTQVAVSILFLICFSLIGYVAKTHSDNLVKLTEAYHSLDKGLAEKSRLQREVDELKAKLEKVEQLSVSQRLLQLEKALDKLTSTLESMLKIPSHLKIPEVKQNAY